MRALKERFLVAIIGILAVLLVIETGLRITGYIHYKSTHLERVPPKGKNEYVILCLGDSYTYGMGARREGPYPKQLEELMGEEVRGARIRVTNKGVGGFNTAQILDVLDDHIEQASTNIVVLLAGRTNEWNFWGFKKIPKGNRAISKIHNVLYRIRLYKLVKLMASNLSESGKTLMPPVSSREGMSYDKMEINRFASDNWRYKYQYTRAMRFAKEPASRDDAGEEISGESIHYHNVGARLFGEGDYEQARMWLEKSIEQDSENDESYVGMGDIYYQSSEYEEAIKWFEKAIEINPHNSVTCNLLGNSFRAIGMFHEAAGWYKRGIEADSENHYNYRYLESLPNTYNGKELEWFKKALEIDPHDPKSLRSLVIHSINENKREDGIRFLRKIEKQNPRVKDFIPILADEDLNELAEDIERWITADIEEIIQTCEENDVDMIIQNYPFPSAVNSLLQKIAEENNILFVNNNQTFEELWKKGEKRRNYFNPDHHCNARGYGMIAGNVSEKIHELRRKRGLPAGNL